MGRRRPILRAAYAALLMVTSLAHADERVDVTAMDGVQLNAELEGMKGPGVVMVHDVGEDRRSWQATGEVVAAAGFRVLRIDLRGHGASGGSIAFDLADRDVEGAYRYLIARKVRPVFLMAKGRAAEAVVRVAARVPTAGIVLVGVGETSSVGIGVTPVLRLDEAASAAARDRLVAFFGAPDR